MDFAQHWVFGGGPGAWSLYVAGYTIGVFGFLAFNHQKFTEKLLNTGRFTWAFGLAILFATGNIIKWGEDARLWLPLVQLGWTLVIVVASDWTAFIIWCIATGKHKQKDTPFYRAVMWVRDTGQRLRSRFVKLPEDTLA